MKYFMIVFFILFSFFCYAAIYKQVDQNGNTIYSDVPIHSNAKAINLPETGSTTTTKSNETKTPIAQQIPVIKFKKPYTVLMITSPKDQETIQNQPIIPVDLKIEPALQEGDKIQIYLDGKPVGQPQAGTHIELSLIDRGSHQLYASLIDSSQTTLKQSNVITIYVHREHLGNSSKP